MMIRILFSTIVLACMSIGASAQDYYDGKLLAPDSLVSILEIAPESVVVLNTGPVADIKNAINIGAVDNKKNLNKLKKMLPKLSKEKTMVVYCGCCPLVVCPNLEPAVQLFEKNNYKVVILNLPEGIEEDWVSKKYPMK